MSTSPIIGRQVQFGIAKEGTRGTAESSADFFMPFSDLTYDDQDSKVVDQESQGVVEDSVGQTIDKQWSEGTLKGPITDKAFALLLHSILGSLASAVDADGSGDVYDHTITVAQSAQHQSLTFFVNDPAATSDAQDYVFPLGVVSKLDLDYEQDKFINYSATLRAQKGTQTAVTPSTNTENRFVAKHVTFKIASALSGLAGASAMKIQSLSLSIDQNIDDDMVLGSEGVNDFLSKGITITGQLQARWDSEAAFKQFALAGTAKALRIDLQNSDVTIGSSAHPGLTIDLAKVVFEAPARKFTLGDIVVQTLNFKAHYSVGDSKMITAKAVNLQSSY
jgi:hypothetical protein